MPDFHEFSNFLGNFLGVQVRGFQTSLGRLFETFWGFGALGRNM